MRIRATVFVALLVVSAIGGLSLGAQASNPSIGLSKVVVDLPLPPFDTVDYVVSSLANDTVGPFYSVTFGFHDKFTQINGRIFQNVADTATQTAGCRDSVIFLVETKTDDDKDVNWFTLWTSGVISCASFDTTGGDSPTQAGMINIPSDSLVSMGDLFRVKYFLVMEEDSLTSAADLHYDSDSTFNPLQSFKAALFFRLK